MKKAFPLIFVVVLYACSAPRVSFIQVYETKANSPVRSDNGHYVFENDTIKIDYGFWTERGVLAFKIENKLNVPLYVDWSRSSFIRNGEKLDFWIDEQKTNVASYYQGYNTSANFWQQLYSTYRMTYGIPYTLGLSEGETQSASTTTKPEKTTFIAPKSYIFKTPRTLHLFGVSGTKLRTDRDYVEIYGLNSKNEQVVKTKEYYADYDKDESVLKFRNFLMLSTSKDFTSEFYVDNSFYVSRVYEMRDVPLPDTLKKPNNFYIHIAEALAIETRLKTK